jgi:hypothetical protein
MRWLAGLVISMACLTVVAIATQANRIQSNPAVQAQAEIAVSSLQQMYSNGRELPEQSAPSP